MQFTPSPSRVTLKKNSHTNITSFSQFCYLPVCTGNLILQVRNLHDDCTITSVSTMFVYIKFVLNLEKRRIKQIIHIRKTFLDEDGF